jgi:hypothetical protein
MENVREVIVGQEALDFLCGQLALGKTLARSLLHRLTTRAGLIVAPVPDDVPESSVLEFTEGLWSPAPEEAGETVVAPDGSRMRIVPKPNLDSWLIEKIRAYLAREGPDPRVCVFENDSASPDAPWLRLRPIRTLTFDEEVYHVVRRGDTDDVIAATVRASQSWLFVGIFSTAPRGQDITATRSLTAPQLEELARNAEAVLLGTYDGEGYLFWTPESLETRLADQ